MNISHKGKYSLRYHMTQLRGKKDLILALRPAGKPTPFRTKAMFPHHGYEGSSYKQPRDLGRECGSGEALK